MEGRGCQGTDSPEGPMQGTLIPMGISPTLRRIATGCKSVLLRNRMRECCTSGSVGGLGGQPPRSTRHFGVCAEDAGCRSFAGPGVFLSGGLQREVQGRCMTWYSRSGGEGWGLRSHMRGVGPRQMLAHRRARDFTLRGDLAYWTAGHGPRRCCDKGPLRPRSAIAGRQGETAIRLDGARSSNDPI